MKEREEREREREREGWRERDYGEEKLLKYLKDSLSSCANFCIAV